MIGESSSAFVLSEPDQSREAGQKNLLCYVKGPTLCQIDFAKVF